VRSASGQIMRSDRGVLFCSRLEPGKTVPVGLVAAGSLLDTLQAARAVMDSKTVGELKRETRRERRRKVATKLGTFKLEELLDRPALGHATGDRQLAEQLDVLHEVRKLHQTLREQLRGFLAGEQLQQVKADLRQMQLRSDPGGWLLNWVARNKDGLPEQVRLAHENLALHFTALSPEDEALCWETLIYFKIHHTFIQSGLAVKPFMEDLNYLRELPENNPLRSRYAGLLEKHAWVERRLQKGALTLAELGEMIEMPFMNLRAEVGAAKLAEHAAALEFVEQRLAPLFFESGRLREDCLDLTIPWQRLSQHLYAQPVGVRNPHFEKTAHEGCLLRSDFEAAFNFIVLARFYGKETDQLTRSFSVPQLTAMCDTLAFAAAKLTVLEKALNDEESKTGKPLFKKEERLSAQDLRLWSPPPALLLGRRFEYSSAAEFAEISGMALPELLRRAAARQDLQGFPSRMALNKSPGRDSRPGSLLPIRSEGTTDDCGQAGCEAGIGRRSRSAGEFEQSLQHSCQPASALLEHADCQGCSGCHG